MIARLSGKVAYKGISHIIIDVGGVGYQVYLTRTAMGIAPAEGEEYSCFTYLAVRENALDLYGFENRAELEFFESLLGVSGIGPKSAIGILSVAPVDLLKSAIGSGEAAHLTRVAGIGKKTAEKIVVELRDKLGAEGGESGFSSEDADALEALQSLGYSLSEARDALQNIPSDIEGTKDKLAAALRSLGK